MSDDREQGATTARVLTGEGLGAIAVVQVLGPDALLVVDRLFLPRFRRSLRASGLNTPRLGNFGGEAGEEVVVIPIADNPPEVEIHGHGGSAAVSAILESLRAEGVAVAQTGPVLDSDKGPWAGSALELLGHAPSLRVAEILLDQSSGAFDRDWEDLRREFASNPVAARRRVETLLKRGTTGVRMVDGWAVALTGRPNVGKSRLLNALAGFRRAVVSETPGTTRDVVSTKTAFDGWPVELFDTAGLRPTADPLEALGIARAHARVASADLVLVVLDGSEPLTEEDQGPLNAYPHAMRVVNKADLPPAWDDHEWGAFRVSAATGEGLPALMKAIADRLIPSPPPPGSAVPFTRGMVQALEKFRDESHT